MLISRRRLLRYCLLSAGALGLGPGEGWLLRRLLANPSGPSVIWLIGSACTGCSISFLNRISDVAGEPATVTDVLADSLNVLFHPTLMGSAGETAAATLERVRDEGNFILMLEGAVPTRFGGHACVVYQRNGRAVTYQEAVQDLTARASKTLCVGTCAAFGGISAAGSNPTGAMGVGQLTGRPVISLSGCPVNPDWVVWAVVQLLLGREIELDEDRRPMALYNRDLGGGAAEPILHDKCPRNPGLHGTPVAVSFGEDGHCLENLGCRGPHTKARCDGCWNGIAGNVAGQPHAGRWCIGVNAPCHGCVEKTFPGLQSFFEPYVP
ncbi:MAG TPA: iron hydrogenase [Verrucomicrobiota bacterium]|nr:iron hydrogenase [Verrucomicrobiota bacterium]